jgi:phosphoribosyl 1,2-cyclic phosphodiesterase
MKLKILGSSSSGNGYILEASDGALVIECGMPLIEVKKALDFKIGRIVGAIVTHQHGDHSKFIAEYLKSAIRVCALKEVFDAHALTQRIFCKEIEPMHGYRIGTFNVFVVPVEHDVPCVGFIIEHAEMGKILFVTDTMMFEYRIPNLSHMMIEANYSDEILDYNIENGITPASMRPRLLQSHMEIKTTENIVLSSNLDTVNDIILIHLSHNNSDAEQFKQRIMQKTGKPVIIAKRGVCVDVSKAPY